MRQFIEKYTDYEENKCDETYLDNLDKNLIFMQFPRIMKEYMMYQYDIVGQQLRDFIVMFYA